MIECRQHLAIHGTSEPTHMAYQVAYAIGFSVSPTRGGFSTDSAPVRVRYHARPNGLSVPCRMPASEQGKESGTALIEAATLRLRPILMTTGAMVLGALPLAFSTGAGAESRAQIGWVITGGMTFSALLTLFAVSLRRGPPGIGH